MKKAISILLAAVMLLCILPTGVFAARGNTYYVDSENGSDENNGLSPETAWKNLCEHNDFSFAPGDTILLKSGGTYPGRFQPVVSGTKEEPITVSSYGEGTKPLLITSDMSPAILLYNVSGWNVDGLEFTSKHGAGILVYAMPYDECPLDFTYIEPSEPSVPEQPSEPVVPELPKIDLKALPEKLTEIANSLKDTLKLVAETIASVLGYRPPTTPPESKRIISYFRITNCVFHDIAFEDVDVSGSCTPIYIRSSGAGARVDNVYISDINIYNCAYGIKTAGSDTQDSYFESVEETYNNNVTLENITIDTTNYDAVIFGSLENGVARNLTLLNTCLYDEWYTAPIWLHNCDHVLIENSEIGGAVNWMDAMSVDFDGHTQNSTYQYIYSHDNASLMKNNNFDVYTENRNNTVRYCLSVNDNRTINAAALSNIKDGEMAIAMENYKFYNNTIINCAPTLFGILKNSTVANNIFVGGDDVLSISLPLGWNNNFTNNCFYNMNPTLMSKNNFTCDPGFIGTDETDKNSFILSKDSPLIGKGIQVEEDMGEYDFYGNKLTKTHNIGCYDGAGADSAPVETERHGIRYIINAIKLIVFFVPKIPHLLG